MGVLLQFYLFSLYLLFTSLSSSHSMDSFLSCLPLLLTHTHLLMCLLMHSSAYSDAYSCAAFAYSYTVVVQYIRTG